MNTPAPGTPSPTPPADQNNPDPAAGGPTPPVPAPPSPTPPAEDGKPAGNAEAARRRTQLRETEAERDTLRTSLDDAHRTIVEQMITASEDLPFLHNTADLWDVIGADVADLRDENGAIDPELVAEALTEAQTARPYLFGDRPDPVDRGTLAKLMGRQVTVPGHKGNPMQAGMRKLLNPAAAPNTGPTTGSVGRR